MDDDSKRWIYQVFAGRWDFPFPVENFWSGCLQLDWSHLTEIGCGCVYFLGIWDSRGELYVEEEEGIDLLTQEHRLPSMMAIRDHVTLNPTLGLAEDFTRLVQKIQSLQMRVIVDFVPNHTSLQHPWIQEHPDWYVWHEGKIVREFSGDVAKLNYDNSDLLYAMTQIVITIAQSGVNGVRVDMAHLIPVEAWKTIISAVKKSFPGFVFIAEAYPISHFEYRNIDDLLQAGFDQTYDPHFFENCNRAIDDATKLPDVIAHMTWMRRTFPYQSVAYLGNHDDPPLNNRRHDSDRVKKFETLHMAMLAFALWGNHRLLIANGFLHAYPHRLAHHYDEKLTVDDNEIVSVIPEHIRTLLKLHNEYPTSKNLQLRIEHNLCVLTWIYQERVFELICNVTDQSIAHEITGITTELFSYNYSPHTFPSGSVLFLSRD